MNIKYVISEELTEAISTDGPFIIISSHPLGGIDGSILVDISDIPFAMLDNLAKELEDSQVKERFKPVLIMHSAVQENVC